jgi:hypothetical protein
MGEGFFMTRLWMMLVAVIAVLTADTTAHSKSKM